MKILDIIWKGSTLGLVTASIGLGGLGAYKAYEFASNYASWKGDKVI
jgi:hypothetical protein